MEHSRSHIRNNGAHALRHRECGFTLIELMIVLVIMGALLSVGAPAFRELILDNRSVSALYDLRGAMGVARSEALAQRTFVTFCSSNDAATCSGTWEDGYIAFADFDGDAVIDAGGVNPDDLIVLVSDGTYEGLNIALAADNGNNRLRFDPAGTALGNGGTFTVCDERGAESARAIFLSNSGQTRSLVDANDDSIPNLPAVSGGANVTCP